MQENSMLIVDDEPNIIQALKRVFMDEPYIIYGAANAAEAIAILKKQAIKVIITDECMPDVTGTELLSIVRTSFPDTVRIMLTGKASIDAAMQAINQGEIYRFFRKPWDDIEILYTVRSAMEKYDLETENRLLVDTLKRQRLNMKLLEKQFPGISKVEYDNRGCIIAEDVSDEELKKLITECEKLK